MAAIPLAVITDEFTQDFEQACSAAVELGIPALEVRSIWNKNIVDLSDAEISEIDKLAKAAGLRIISVASPVFKCTLPDGGEIDRRFQQDAFHAAHAYHDQPRILDRSLKIAQTLGASIVRVFAFWRTVEPQRLTGRIIAELRKAAAIAGPTGVRIGLENEHACNIATATESAAVLAAIQDPNLGLVWDPANAFVAGEIPFPDGFKLLPMERILHVHAKDCLLPPGAHNATWAELGSGEIDWKGQFAALARGRYPGMVSLETHWGGPGGNKFEGSRLCAMNLKKLSAAAA